jgi:hypothetical protein
VSRVVHTPPQPLRLSRRAALTDREIVEASARTLGRPPKAVRAALKSPEVKALEAAIRALVAGASKSQALRVLAKEWPEAEGKGGPLDALAADLGVPVEVLRKALERHRDAVEEVAANAPAVDAPLSDDSAQKIRQRHRRAGIPEAVTEATLRDLKARA